MRTRTDRVGQVSWKTADGGEIERFDDRASCSFSGLTPVGIRDLLLKYIHTWGISHEDADPSIRTKNFRVAGSRLSTIGLPPFILLIGCCSRQIQRPYSLCVTTSKQRKQLPGDPQLSLNQKDLFLVVRRQYSLPLSIPSIGLSFFINNSWNPTKIIIMSSSQASQASDRTPPVTPSRHILAGPPEDEIVFNQGQSSSLSNLVAKAASMCNRIVVEKCAMCTVYCDEQLRHELMAVPQATMSPSVWLPTSLLDDMDDNIQTARHYLFDEESVVHSLSDRWIGGGPVIHRYQEDLPDERTIIGRFHPCKWHLT